MTEVIIDAPVERVWRALREPAELRRWHGWDYPGLDAELEEIYGSGALVDDDARKLASNGTEIRVAPGTAVTFRLTMSPTEEWYGTVREGWLTFGQQLRFALERHPGEDRTTRYLDGPQERPAVGGPGERWAWRGLTGEVWFRSEHQLGLTVDQWGDGLAVLQDSAAVLTGYGVTPEWGPA